jgi:hypothetical protein
MLFSENSSLIMKNDHLVVTFSKVARRTDATGAVRLNNSHNKNAIFLVVNELKGQSKLILVNGPETGVGHQISQYLEFLNLKIPFVFNLKITLTFIYLNLFVLLKD